MASNIKSTKSDPLQRINLTKIELKSEKLTLNYKSDISCKVW